MELEHYLQKIGLSDKESRLYLAGLELGPAFLQELVDVSKLKRATVYDLIESLKDKGLIKTISKGKRKMYLAESPENLLSLIKQKENIVNQIFGQLLAIQNTDGKRPKVKIFQGVAGIREIYLDLLAKRQEHIEFLSAAKPDKDIEQYWEHEHIPRRVKLGHSVRVLAPDTPFFRRWKSQDKHVLRETRLLPVQEFPFQNEIYVYHGKVGFITHDGDNSFGLVIESQEIFKTFEFLLNGFWNSMSIESQEQK